MFEDFISAIEPLDTVAMEQCQIRLDNLTKPLNSLHSFEHIARQMAGITKQYKPQCMQKSMIVMAGDHGVCGEVNHSCGPMMTAQMIAHACQGRAAIAVFAEHVKAQLVVVDMGVATDVSQYSQLQDNKIAYGTKNITEQAAMTREQAMAAISVGIKIAQEQLKAGSSILGLGALGRGSIIPCTAIVACYSAKTAAELLEGSSEKRPEILKQELAVLRAAVALQQPNTKDVLDVISKLGGLEIAGLVGVIIGAAAGRAAVVLDGLVTSVAALLAVKMAPQVKEYLVASHFAVEAAHQEALALIGVPGYLHMDMHSGDGTGAVLGISLINASLHVINDMKTFGEAEVPVAQDGPGALKQRTDIR